MVTRSRKLIADGGTAPHAVICACGVKIIHHRRVGGGFLVLDFEPLEGGRFVIFGGAALSDPDPRNLPEGQSLYREHVCASAPGDDVAHRATSSLDVGATLAADGITANLCQVQVRTPEDAAALTELVRGVHAHMATQEPDDPTERAFMARRRPRKRATR